MSSLTSPHPTRAVHFDLNLLCVVQNARNLPLPPSYLVPSSATHQTLQPTSTPPSYNCTWM